jgi:hypothetical protein
MSNRARAAQGYRSATSATRLGFEFDFQRYQPFFKDSDSRYPHAVLHRSAAGLELGAQRVERCDAGLASPARRSAK